MPLIFFATRRKLTVVNITWKCHRCFRLCCCFSAFTCCLQRVIDLYVKKKRRTSVLKNQRRLTAPLDQRVCFCVYLSEGQRDCIMFLLVEMVDTVRIPPWNFQRQLNEAIAEELNKKLANKVCACTYLHMCKYM